MWREETKFWDKKNERAMSEKNCADRFPSLANVIEKRISLLRAADQTIFFTNNSA
jgi:hypothetical protein